MKPLQINTATRKRLFFALWPDEHIREQCSAILQNIDSQAIRLVAPENLHVTLVFLGNVNQDQEYILRAEMAKIVMPPLEICFNQLSYWKKPDVLCLTTSEIGKEIKQLVSDLTVIADRLNLKVDKRSYQPHVTLARKVTGAKALAFAPIVWRATSFCLVESCPSATKSDYRIIAQWDCQTIATK